MVASAAAPSGWRPRRGEVYFTFVHKRRPVVVLSRDSLNTYSLDICVVPLTRVQRRTFWFRPEIPAGEAGLRSASWAKCDQVATIPRASLEYPATGSLSSKSLSDIVQGVKIALQL